MGELEFLRQEIPRAWEWLELTVSDVTDDVANWSPPGTANSIGTTYVHIIINTDVEVNRMVHGRVPVIESQWAGDAGLGAPYDSVDFDTWVPDARVDWDRLHAYGRSVHETLVGSLDSLTDADLDRPVDMSRSGLGMWEGRDLYLLHGWRHVYMHGGEIACLKGLQGGKGYLGGMDSEAGPTR